MALVELCLGYRSLRGDGLAEGRHLRRFQEVGIGSVEDLAYPSETEVRGVLRDSAADRVEPGGSL